MNQFDRKTYQERGYCPPTVRPTQARCNPIAPFNPTNLVSGMPMGPYYIDLGEDAPMKEAFVPRRVSSRFPASGYAGLQRHVSHGCGCGGGIGVPLEDDGIWWGYRR